jgi:mono/diheme cytochrome c family protein
VRSVFLKILVFVVMIDLFYMSIGRFYLTQAEKHPPVALQISTETDTDTLVGMGEGLLKNKGGCLLCHKITEVGNTRGPDLRGVGGRASTRKPGMTAEAYLTESLVAPGAYIVEGFETAGGESIMPAADRPPADMTATELKALVAYLQSQSGEVTVQITAQDVASADARKQDKPAPTPTHPGFALLTAKACSACHDIIGDARMVGPPLSKVGERLSAAEIRQSIVDPNAVIAEGFQPGLMLQTFADTLSTEELDQLVGYLSGEVGLTERLAHPGFHLLILMVVFNGGIALAARKVESIGRTKSNETNLGWVGALGSLTLIGVLYWQWTTETPEPLPSPAEPPPVQQEEIKAPARATTQSTTPSPAAAAGETALDGEALFKVSCPACHGQDAKGMPGLGKDMTNSAFIAGLSDLELVEFIKQGRTADDPMNTTGVAMPPKGFNASLSDDDMMAIVEYMRTLQQ